MVKVTVDWNKCDGDGVCVDVCPVDVFELQDLAEYPDTQKSVPVRADGVIEVVCRTLPCTSIPLKNRLGVATIRTPLYYPCTTTVY